MSDVIVKLVSGTKTLAFTSSNAKGEYSLELKSAPSGEVALQFTHISYELVISRGCYAPPGY